MARNLNAPLCSVAQGVTENGAMNDIADVPATSDGTAPPGDFVRRHLEWIQQNERAERFLGRASEIRRGGCAVDPSVDRTLNALNSSDAKDVMESDTVDNSADILARCASTTLADAFVRQCRRGIQMATEPGCYFGEIALQAAVTAYRL